MIWDSLSSSDYNTRVVIIIRMHLISCFSIKPPNIYRHFKRLFALESIVISQIIGISINSSCVSNNGNSLRV